MRQINLLIIHCSATKKTNPSRCKHWKHHTEEEDSMASVIITTFENPER